MLFNLLQDPPLLIIVPLAIIIVISLHEFSHALMGYLLGDKTAEHEGRLTLNPLAHLDPFGTIMLLIVGFGWGKPVPFNPYNLKYQKWGPAWIALAGPVSNFLSAIFFAVVLKIVSNFVDPNSYVVVFLFYLIFFDIILGLFNLIPIPPLDGSKLLFALLPLKYENVAFWLQRNGSFLLMALLIFMYFSNGNFFGVIVNFFLKGILSLMG